MAQFRVTSAIAVFLTAVLATGAVTRLTSFTAETSHGIVLVGSLGLVGLAALAGARLAGTRRTTYW